MKKDCNPLTGEKTPILIVISGPSAVGKDTVLKCMQDQRYPFHFVLTVTSRPPREKEVDGVDYFFVSRQRFEEMIHNGELLEYALVYEDYKGIPKDQVRQALSSGKDVILRIDVQGAATIRSLCPEALLIFLTADFEELERRIRERKGDSAESIAKRLLTAREELDRAGEFDFIVWNHEQCLDDTVNTIQAIIHSEHHRTHPRKVTL